DQHRKPSLGGKVAYGRTSRGVATTMFQRSCAVERRLACPGKAPQAHGSSSHGAARMACPSVSGMRPETQCCWLRRRLHRWVATRIVAKQAGSFDRVRDGCDDGVVAIRLHDSAHLEGVLARGGADRLAERDAADALLRDAEPRLAVVPAGEARADEPATVVDRACGGHVDLDDRHDDGPPVTR